MSTSSISPTKRTKVYLKTNGKCWYCGQELVISDEQSWFASRTPRAKNAFVIDHVIAKTRGGNHHIDNLVPCCFICNCRKCNRTIEEFRRISAIPVAITDDHINFVESMGLTNFRNKLEQRVKDYKFWFETENMK